VTDHDDAHAGAPAQGDEAQSTPHMPPNSLVPIVIALSLALLFVGFLHEVRDVIGPVMWLLGLLGVIGGCAMWTVSARREYHELPEEGGH
jgi:RsiW-degrading membrane proteinase PrsW (M82 family)